METEKLTLFSENDLWSKIHIVRGAQVMLDFDLTAIYGYETKYFNRQVNNNLARFDEDFRFQLTEEEFTNLRCKNFTSSWGGKRYPPYAFTEEGIYMLMTVEADIAYADIYSLAKRTIHIIDSYIGLKTLVLLKSIAPNVKVTIFSDNTGRNLHQTEFEDFRREYPDVDITLKTTENIYHDRYIIIDHDTPEEIIFHCGGSSKDGGRRITSISQVENLVLYQNIVSNLEKNPALLL